MKQKNTNWNHYKAFITVYEIRNMHRAANILGITRSAISHNMKELGKQLGAALFTSHNKGVEPTSKAIDIYPMIKGAVDAIAEAENYMSTAGDEKTTIEMAVSATSVEVLVEDYLKEFRIKHPEIKLKVSMLEGMDLSKQKQQDFILTSAHRVPPNFKTINLYTTAPAFFATKDFLKKHRLTKTISKEQLVKFPIITRETGEAWINFCKQVGAGKASTNVLSVMSSSMIYNMTKNSDGIGFFGEAMLDMTNDRGLVALNVSGVASKTVQYVCGYDEILTKSARTFIDGFSKFCQNRLSGKGKRVVKNPGRKAGKKAVKKLKNKVGKS